MVSGHKSILIKVDKDTFQKMHEVDMNWSAAIRAYITKELLVSRNRAKAVSLTDEIFANHKTKSSDESTGIIRAFRDKGHGTKNNS